MWSSSRGPLSLYLFILAEEILSLQLVMLKTSGAIVPISPVPSTPYHLLYADDILLFLIAHESGLRSAQELLTEYQASFGQRFNFQKSQLSLGECFAMQAHMITGLLIPRASLPSVYLRVPIFQGSSRHTHFNLLLDSIRSRLDGWKMKCLSSDGRLILVKHVLSFIPLHFSLVLPITCETNLQIERLMRNFLWSASSEKQRSNLVNWELVCLPKTEGGPGLHRVKEFNEDCLFKLGKYAASSDSLWAHWFHGRYFRTSSIWHSRNPKDGSCIWKRIRSLALHL